jgi:hypothetical protein
MRILRLVVGCMVLLAGIAIGAAPASAQPDVSVAPASGLAGGDTVSVTASGLTPSAAVDVIQCDIFVGDPEQDCFVSTTTAADASGGVSVDVVLADPVYRSEPFGDPRPVYCRADACRIFLVWTDSDGNQQVLSSDPLEFTGSPATIAVTPHTKLNKHRSVSVTGTADGAQGRTVRILEEACFSIVQGSGCYGQLPAVTTTVRANGSFATRYTARRFLADGTDCADPDILGFCEISVVVLDANGNPDDSFGLSRIGQPAAPLSFRG